MGCCRHRNSSALAAPRTCTLNKLPIPCPLLPGATARRDQRQEHPTHIMALRGPSDFSKEPPRHPSLRINAKVPSLLRSTIQLWPLTKKKDAEETEQHRSRSTRSRRGGTWWPPTSPPSTSSSSATTDPSPFSTTPQGTLFFTSFGRRPTGRRSMPTDVWLSEDDDTLLR